MVPRWRPSTIAEHRLPGGTPGPNVPFERVLDERRTIRELRPASYERIGALLWHAARTRAAGSGWEHRAAPSAGALHPINIILVGLTPAPALYDATRHVLSEMDVVDRSGLDTSVRSARELVPTANGLLAFLAADALRTAAAYDCSDSLLWRDAGCVIATLQLVAAWLGLAAVPLGILGADFVNAVAPDQGLVPVGVLVLGEPTVGGV